MKQTQKTYNNIIYLRNNIITIKNKNEYYDLIMSTKSLNNGFIQNKELFINELYKYLKKYHINKFLWRKNILIITDFIYSYNEKKVLKETFREIGYKDIFINPIESMLKVNKEDYYLINSNTLRLLYVDNINKKGVLELDLDILSDDEIITLLKNRCKNKRLFIINQSPKIISLIDKLKINYYYFEKKYNYF